MATAEVTPKQQTQALARLDTQALLSKAIESNANIETMERLVALAKDMKAQLAREAWYEAMAAFQRECPPIKKTKDASIQMRGGGSYKYSYAPLDEITATAGPILGKHGLSYSWRSRLERDQVVVSCRVSHVLGHSEDSGDTCIPIVQGDGGGANPMQRVGIATTYAKRYSLIGILGVAPEDDDDAQAVPERPRRRAAPAAAEVEAESPEAVERKALLDTIKETAGALRLSTDDRQKLWQQHCGDARPERADLATLADLRDALRAKLPKVEGAA